MKIDIPSRTELQGFIKEIFKKESKSFLSLLDKYDKRIQQMEDKINILLDYIEKLENGEY